MTPPPLPFCPPILQAKSSRLTYHFFFFAGFPLGTQFEHHSPISLGGFFGLCAPPPQYVSLNLSPFFLPPPPRSISKRHTFPGVPFFPLFGSSFFFCKQFPSLRTSSVAVSTCPFPFSDALVLLSDAFFVVGVPSSPLWPFPNFLSSFSRTSGPSFSWVFPEPLAYIAAGTVCPILPTSARFPPQTPLFLDRSSSPLFVFPFLRNESAPLVFEFSSAYLSLYFFPFFPPG